MFKTKDIYVEVGPAPQAAAPSSAPAPQPAPVQTSAPTPVNVTAVPKSEDSVLSPDDVAPVPKDENRVLNSGQVKNIVLDLVKMSSDDVLMRIGGMQIPAIDKKIIYNAYKKVAQKFDPKI